MIKKYLFECHKIHLSPSCWRPSSWGKGSTSVLCVSGILWELVFGPCQSNRSRSPRWFAQMSLTQKVDGISLVRFSSLSRGRWTCLSPSCKTQSSPPKLLMCNLVPNPAHRILQSSSWTYFTHKWQERNVIKNQRAYIIFYFIMNCTGYCIFVQIKMSQTSVSFACYSSIPVKPNVSHSVINTSLQK